MAARPPLRSSVGLALFLAVLWGGGAFWKSWQSDQLGAEVARLAQAGDIRMISSETCVYCEKARAWFTAHRVPFAECFVESETACADAYRALQAPVTPLLLVRGERQLGFSPPRIAQALR